VIASNDWRGIHPKATLLRKWFVATTIREGHDGVLRDIYACYTKAGAIRRCIRMNERVQLRNQEYVEALLPPWNIRYELVGHLSDHPGNTGEREPRAPSSSPL
jgi:hypothetical protein